jgi:hypothetical protein
MAYVSQDGSYGTAETILFDYHELSGSEWDKLDEIGEDYKYDFVAKILKAKEQNEV